MRQSLNVLAHGPNERGTGPVCRIRRWLLVSGEGLCWLTRLVGVGLDQHSNVGCWCLLGPCANTLIHEY